MSFIRPEYQEPHNSTKLWKAFRTYLARYYDVAIFNDACRDLGVEPEYLLDDDNWVSNRFTDDFMALLVQKTGDPDLATRVGEETLHADNINRFEATIIRTMGAFLFVKSLPAQAAKINQFFSYHVSEARLGHFVLSAIPKFKERPSDHMCKNTLGLFQSIKKFFEMADLEVQHEICTIKGDDRCVYSIDYKMGRRTVFRFLRTISVIAGFILGVQWLASLSSLDPAILSTLSILAVLGISASAAAWIFFQKYRSLVAYSEHYYSQSRKKNQALYHSVTKLDRRFRESKLLRDLSMELVKTRNPASVIGRCLDSVQNNFGYSKTILMLVSNSRKVLYVESARGMGSVDERLLSLELKYPAEKHDPQLFANILNRGETILIDDVESYKSVLKVENRQLLDILNVSSFIVSPIQYENNKYGLLAVGTIQDEKRLSQEDKVMIENITTQLSLFFQNAKTYENERVLRGVFEKYVPMSVVGDLNNLNEEKSGFLAPKDVFITSFFIDMRNFTTISETLPPEKVFDLVSTFNQYCTAYIAEEGGIIDNIVGDAIIAFFPAAANMRTLHARRAVRAACKILANWKTLDEICVQKGFPKITFGIGIHSGHATVGSLGSEVRYSYTAMGDTVNVASRLQDLSKAHIKDMPEGVSQSIAVISHTTKERTNSLKGLTSVASDKVKGRSEAVDYYVVDALQATEFLQRDEAEAEESNQSSRAKDRRSA